MFFVMMPSLLKQAAVAFARTAQCRICGDPTIYGLASSSDVLLSLGLRGNEDCVAHAVQKLLIGGSDGSQRTA